MEKYIVVKKIGTGSFGAAYLVSVKQNLQQQYVLKKIQQTSGNESQQPQREVELLAALNHPFVLGYLEHFTYKGQLCIITDYCEHGDLYSHLQQGRQNKDSCGGVVPESQALAWFAQVLVAIQHVHAHAVLHRDLKTQNLFLTKDGYIKLGDFGIARTLESGTCGMASTMIGSPVYMSPEALQGQRYDYKSDCWSLGCVLFELLTGLPAFDAPDMPSLIARVVAGTHQPLPDYAASPAVRELVQLLLSTDPQLRPTPQEMMAMPELQPYVRAALALAAQHQNGKLGATEPKATNATEHYIALPQATIGTGAVTAAAAAAALPTSGDRHSIRHCRSSMNHSADSAGAATGDAGAGVGAGGAIAGRRAVKVLGRKSLSSTPSFTSQHGCCDDNGAAAGDPGGDELEGELAAAKARLRLIESQREAVREQLLKYQQDASLALHLQPQPAQTATASTADAAAATATNGHLLYVQHHNQPPQGRIAAGAGWVPDCQHKEQQHYPAITNSLTQIASTGDSNSTTAASVQYKPYPQLMLDSCSCSGSGADGHGSSSSAAALAAAAAAKVLAPDSFANLASGSGTQHAAAAVAKLSAPHHGQQLAAAAAAAAEAVAAIEALLTSGADVSSCNSNSFNNRPQALHGASQPCDESCNFTSPAAPGSQQSHKQLPHRNVSFTNDGGGCRMEHKNCSTCKWTSGNAEECSGVGAGGGRGGSSISAPSSTCGSARVSRNQVQLLGLTPSTEAAVNSTAGATLSIEASRSSSGFFAAGIAGVEACAGMPAMVGRRRSRVSLSDCDAPGNSGYSVNAAAVAAATSAGANVAEAGATGFCSPRGAVGQLVTSGNGFAGFPGGLPGDSGSSRKPAGWSFAAALDKGGLMEHTGSGGGSISISGSGRGGISSNSSSGVACAELVRQRREQQQALECKRREGELEEARRSYAAERRAAQARVAGLFGSGPDSDDLKPVLLNGGPILATAPMMSSAVPAAAAAAGAGVAAGSNSSASKPPLAARRSARQLISPSSQAGDSGSAAGAASTGTPALRGVGSVAVSPSTTPPAVSAASSFTNVSAGSPRLQGHVAVAAAVTAAAAAAALPARLGFKKHADGDAEEDESELDRQLEALAAARRSRRRPQVAAAVVTGSISAKSIVEMAKAVDHAAAAGHAAGGAAVAAKGGSHAASHHSIAAWH